MNANVTPAITDKSPPPFSFLLLRRLLGGLRLIGIGVGVSEDCFVSSVSSITVSGT